jgi:hypothetical protein
MCGRSGGNAVEPKDFGGAADSARDVACAPIQREIDYTLAGHRARALFRAQDRIAVELAIRPAGVSAAIVAGTLGAVSRGSENGLKPSCTATYDGLASEVSKLHGKRASRRQVALAINWLKSREWLTVLSAGPGGGSYSIEWPKIEGDVDGEATHRAPSGADEGQQEVRNCTPEKTRAGGRSEARR